MLSKRNLDKTSPPPDYRLYVENVEHQENPEIDALFATTMGNAIIDIPADSPFKGTDLVVFKDGTPGRLPLNGIYESDFKKTSHLYEKIKNRRSLIKIDNSDKKFEKEVLKMILSLLTRRVGRVLIENIVYHKDKIALKIVYDDSKGDVYFVGENTISLAKKTHYYLSSAKQPDAHENGSKAYIGGSKKTYHLNPPEIILAHEMIHHLHYIENSPVIFSPPKPTLGNFTDQEEQETISGLKTFLSIEESKEIAHNIEDDQNFGVFKAYDQSKTWDEINENSFLTAFGKPPRISHDGYIWDPQGQKPLEEYTTSARAESPLELALLHDNYDWAREILKHKELFSQEEVTPLLNVLFKLPLSSSELEKILTRMIQAGIDLKTPPFLTNAVLLAPDDVISFLEKQGLKPSDEEMAFLLVKAKEDKALFLKLYDLYKGHPAYQNVSWAFLACYVGEESFLWDFISSGNLITNQQSINGNTLAHQILLNKDLSKESAEVLLAKIFSLHDFDPYTQNLEGDTVLHLVMKTGYWQYHQDDWHPLLAYANLHIPNNDGKTFIDLVKEASQEHINDQERQFLTGILERHANKGSQS